MFFPWKVRRRMLVWRYGWELDATATIGKSIIMARKVKMRVMSRIQNFVICIKGCSSEMLHFACGVTFVGALIGDCVKQVPEVMASNLVLRLQMGRSCQCRLFNVQVEKLYTTVGGKTPRVVRL